MCVCVLCALTSFGETNTWCKHNIYLNQISLLCTYMRTQANTYTCIYRHLRPSLRASIIPSMASPIILSSPRAVIWLAVGWVRLTAEAKKGGGGVFPRLARLSHTLRHMHTRIQPPTHTYSHRESLLFSFQHTSRFQLHTAVKLFTALSGLNVLHTRYDAVGFGHPWARLIVFECFTSFYLRQEKFAMCIYQSEIPTSVLLIGESRV